MEIIQAYIQALNSLPFYLTAALNSGIFITYISNQINFSIKNRKQNKLRHLKLYRSVGEIKETNNDELNKIIKLLFKVNDKQDYLNIIKEIKIPEELKEIVNTFVQNVDEKNLKYCAKNLKNVKIENKNIIKHFKDYLSNLAKPPFNAGFYHYDTNIIDLFIDSKQVLSHEFIHMCTNNKDHCGFNLNTRYNEEIGRGLNEGYTELLNQRIFKYKHCAYPKNVGIVKLLETFFDDPKELENAFFSNDLDTVIYQFCKYGTKEEFFNLLENLDNFTAGPIPLKDFIKYHKLQFKLYEIIKRSNEPNKIQNFENVLFQNPLNQILKNGFSLIHLKQTSKRLK